MSTQRSMRQVEITQPGPAEVLKIGTAPIPTPGEGEVLIEVQAAGVNRADVLQRMGRYKLPPGVSNILGLEVSGTIAELGPGATRWRVGDSVCALLNSGGYAEYAVTAAVQCLPFPAGLSATEAGSLPETFFTVWLDVFELCSLKAGESLLIHGGSSGIGVTAIQLAKGLGSRVLVTAGSDAKCEACRQLGADVAINYRTADFEKEARDVDVILDMVGGSYVNRNLRTLKQGGRLVYINFMESNKAEIDLAVLMRKQLTITGSHLRPQPVECKGRIAKSLEERAWPLFPAGKIKPVIDSVYPLEDAAEAHRRMESSEHVGKIMLAVR
jgi:NADPH2:quinone reductase